MKTFAVILIAAVVLAGCASEPFSDSIELRDDHPMFETILKCHGIKKHDFVGEIEFSGPTISRREAEARSDLWTKIKNDDVVTPEDLKRAGCDSGAAN